jgi:hypothetical protein
MKLHKRSESVTCTAHAQERTLYSSNLRTTGIIRKHWKCKLLLLQNFRRGNSLSHMQGCGDRLQDANGGTASIRIGMVKFMRHHHTIETIMLLHQTWYQSQRFFVPPCPGTAQLSGACTCVCLADISSVHTIHKSWSPQAQTSPFQTNKTPFDSK